MYIYIYMYICVYIFIHICIYIYIPYWLFPNGYSLLAIPCCRCDLFENPTGATEYCDPRLMKPTALYIYIYTYIYINTNNM